MTKSAILGPFFSQFFSNDENVWVFFFSSLGILIQSGKKC